MFEKEAEDRTKQYMNERVENYNCENTKLETDNYNAGLEQGYEDGFQNGAELGYNKAKEEIEEKQTGMTILPTVQFKRMDWNEDKLWSLIKRLKNDERTKDLFSFSEDEFGRFDFIYNG